MKWRVDVQIDLHDGSQIVGQLFVVPMQRISDLLNDSRSFLPVVTSDGLVAHLSKSSIAKLVQLDEIEPRIETRDPYEVLGVSRDTNSDQLKGIYHDLCKGYHPDRIRGLDLPPDMVALANSRLVRIIDAYRRILDLRGQSQTDAQRAAV